MQKIYTAPKAFQHFGKVRPFNEPFPTDGKDALTNNAKLLFSAIVTSNSFISVSH